MLNNSIKCYRNYKFKPIESFESINFEDYVGPTPESNWVIPGILLVGAYPASNDDEETFELISSILKQGVTKFVCLQEEYRPNVTESMWRNGKYLRPYFNDVKLLVKNKGKFHVFNESNIVKNVKVVDEDNLSFVHFPIKDCGISDDDRVIDLAISLVKAISEGEIIYLHCWGGHGRTGTIVSIMLHLMYGLDSYESMRRCQFVHDMREFPVQVGSPQTQSQRDQVTRVIKKLSCQLQQVDYENTDLVRSSLSKSNSSNATVLTTSSDDSYVESACFSVLERCDSNKNLSLESNHLMPTGSVQQDILVQDLVKESNIPQICMKASQDSQEPEIPNSVSNVSFLQLTYRDILDEKEVNHKNFISIAHPHSNESPNSWSINKIKSFRPVIRRSVIISDRKTHIINQRGRSYSDMDCVDTKQF